MQQCSGFMQRAVRGRGLESHCIPRAKEAEAEEEEEEGEQEAMAIANVAKSMAHNQ